MNQFAVQWGLGYAGSEARSTNGMKITQLITATDIFGRAPVDRCGRRAQIQFIETLLFNQNDDVELNLEINFQISHLRCTRYPLSNSAIEFEARF